MIGIAGSYDFWLKHCTVYYSLVDARLITLWLKRCWVVASKSAV